jgi:hypothetical protein
MPLGHWDGETEEHFHMRCDRNRYTSFLRRKLEEIEQEILWVDKFDTSKELARLKMDTLQKLRIEGKNVLCRLEYIEAEEEIDWHESQEEKK